MNKLLILLPMLCLGIASSSHGTDELDKNNSQTRYNAPSKRTTKNKKINVTTKHKNATINSQDQEPKKKTYPEYSVEFVENFLASHRTVTSEVVYQPTLPTGGWNDAISLSNRIFTNGFHQEWLCAYFSYLGHQPQHGQYTETVGVSFKLRKKDEFYPQLEYPYNDNNNPISLIFQNHQLLKVIYPRNKENNTETGELSFLTIMYPEECGLTPTSIEIGFGEISLFGGRKIYSKGSITVVERDPKTAKTNTVSKTPMTNQDDSDSLSGD